MLQRNESTELIKAFHFNASVVHQSCSTVIYCMHASHKKTAVQTTSLCNKKIIYDAFGLEQNVFLLTCVHILTQVTSYPARLFFSCFLYAGFHSHSVCVCVSVCHGVFSVQTLEGCEILLGPEVTYGPPGLDLFCPVAMTIAHCAEVDAENWNIQLKRKTQDSKWEVRAAEPHLSSTVRPIRILTGLRHSACLSPVVSFPWLAPLFCLVAKCQQEWKEEG